MTDADHRALLHTVAARGPGAEAAMAELYRELHGTVFAFIRRRWGAADDHRVQAVVVESLYEMWRGSDDFTGDSLVKTWVLGIARHKLLDALRQHRCTPAHDDIDAHAESLQDPSADVMQQVSDRQTAETLSYCMARLPDDQRECVHLLLVEALSIEEIAGIQGCASGTVKSRIFHAKRKLRDCVAGCPCHRKEEGSQTDVETRVT